jgi:hypothetical protein
MMQNKNNNMYVMFIAFEFLFFVEEGRHSLCIIAESVSVNEEHQM